MTIRVIQTTAASGSRNLDWIPLNVHQDDFALTWVFNRTGNGHCEAAVQGTLEDVLRPETSALAVTIKALGTADSFTSQSITAPWVAVRLAITSASGNCQVAFRVLQTGT